jgi:hypothetical protein
MTIPQYAALFNQAADAMKQVDATIQVGGPTWAYFDKNTLSQFMDLSGSRADIIDYHHYAMGNPPALSDAAALQQTATWGDEVQWVRAAGPINIPIRMDRSLSPSSPETTTRGGRGARPCRSTTGWECGRATASVWQTNAASPFSVPSLIARGQTDANLQLYAALPAMTVSTIVME